jgi:hypothetical protein
VIDAHCLLILRLKIHTRSDQWMSNIYHLPGLLGIVCMRLYVRTLVADRQLAIAVIAVHVNLGFSSAGRWIPLINIDDLDIKMYACRMNVDQRGRVYINTIDWCMLHCVRPR